MSQKVTFEAFAAGLESIGLDVPKVKVCQMALDSGNVDEATIPTLAAASLREYTPTKGKAPVARLYAVVETSVRGKTTQAHFGQLAKLRQDVAKMEATLPALKALIEDLDTGAENTTIPDGWVISGDDTAGYHSSKG